MKIFDTSCSMAPCTRGKHPAILGIRHRNFDPYHSSRSTIGTVRYFSTWLWRASLTVPKPETMHCCMSAELILSSTGSGSRMDFTRYVNRARVCSFRSTRSWSFRVILPFFGSPLDSIEERREFLSVALVMHRAEFLPWIVSRKGERAGHPRYLDVVGISTIQVGRTENNVEVLNRSEATSRRVIRA